MIYVEINASVVLMDALIKIIYGSGGNETLSELD